MRKFFNFKNMGSWPLDFINLANEIGISLPETNGKTTEGLLLKRPDGNVWNVIPILRTSEDFEILFKFKHISIPNNVFANNEHGLYAFATTFSNCYHFVKGTAGVSSDSSNGLRIYKIIDGSATTLSDTTKSSYTVNATSRFNTAIWYRMSYTKSNNTFKFRHWVGSATEPTTWDLTATNNDYISETTNYHGIMLQGYGNWCWLDFVSYGTNGDSAPSQPLSQKTFYGVVLDKNNNPLSNVYVGLYEKYRGYLIAVARTESSGNYSFVIDATDTDKFFVTAIDYNKQPVVVSFDGVAFPNIT